MGLRDSERLLVSMGGKLAGHAKSIETIGRLVSNTASFAICAEQTVSSSAAMWNKYHEKGAKLSGETALEILGIGLNVAGMAASGKGIVESGNRLGKMVKEGGTTNKMSKGISKSGSKADVLAQNRANGRAFEQQEFAKFSSQNNNAVEQITVKTSSGVRTRVDAIGLDANGNVVINEYKSSLTAPLTDNQKIAFPEIFESGATVVGKGKGIFSGGYQIPSGTKVTIIRPE